MNEFHAVFATDHDQNVYRVSDPGSYGFALARWTKLDELRRGGLTPQFKHYEVRAVTLGPDRPLVGPEVRSHGKYDGAELHASVAVMTNGRGFGKVENAAREAWRLRFGRTFRDRRTGAERVQGDGGWFFYPNGQTAAQGLQGLAAVARRQHLVMKGRDDRWFVVAENV